MYNLIYTMTPEDQILFACLRQDFDERASEKVVSISQHNPVKWDRIPALAEANGVIPLITYNLSKIPEGDLNLPKEVMGQLKRGYIRTILMKKNTQARLAAVVDLLNQYHLEFMLVKGAALNLVVYTQPWYTHSLDIDIVFRKKRKEITPTEEKAVIQELDKLNNSKDPYQTNIEYDFYAHHDTTMNNVIPVRSERVWQDARSVPAFGTTVKIMSPADMFIAAAINACRKRYFRLKSLCDLAEITYRLEDLNWDEVIEKSMAYQCNSIVYTALNVTRSTLGCQVPGTVFAGLKVGSLKNHLLDDLIHFILLKSSVAELSIQSENPHLGRSLSRSLLLTYLSYRADQIPKKMIEIISAMWKQAFTPSLVENRD